MKSIREIKEESKKILKGNVFGVFGNILLITIIFSIIAGIIGGILGGIGGAAGLTIETKTTVELFGVAAESSEKTLFGQIIEFVGSVIGVVGSFGITYYVLNFIRGSKKSLSDSLTFVKNNLVNFFVASLIFEVIMDLDIITNQIPGVVGSLLTFVAGIIVIVATFGLAMFQAIAVDFPKLKGVELIKKSWEMMNGHKLNYFVFMLSFIGWIILCIFIVPIVYVIPYITVAELVYYEELKKLN